MKNSFFSKIIKFCFCIVLLLGLFVSSFKEQINVQADEPVEEVEPNYLTFKAVTENSRVKFSWYSGSNVSYSTNGTDWSTYSKNSWITLVNVDDYVMFKGTNCVTNSSYHFFMSGSIKAGGSVTSLTDGLGNNPDVVLQNSAYQYLFYECSSLIEAPELPAVNLTQYCYRYMFCECDNLTSTPELPATTLAQCCYEGMFSYCYKLVDTCDLPAETLPYGAYQYMFSGCSELVEAPKISAKSVGNYACRSMFNGCYKLNSVDDLDFVTIGEYGCQYMFNNCKLLQTAPEFDDCVSVAKCGCDEMFMYCYKLVKAPALTATTIGEKAYYQMFYECSSLTDAAKMDAETLGINCCANMYYNCQKLVNVYKLPATTLANYCYASMFYNCVALETAPELPATTLAQGCYNGMFSSCIKLKNVNVLPAKIIPNYAYTSMFYYCMALETAPELKATTIGNYSCQSMFNYCCKLTSVPDLPFETIAEGGCYQMFQNCVALETAPKFIETKTVGKESCKQMFSYCSKLKNVYGLTAETLGLRSYQEMFSGCTSLVNAPDILATTLGEACCSSMFSGCSALEVAPELKATTLANSCYASMFYNCIKLTTVIDLPATTLANSCYSSMFSCCIALKTAPVIKATAVGNNSCQEMFYYCTSLVNVPDLSFETIADYGCYQMFDYCTSLVSAPKLGSVTSVGTESCKKMYEYCSSLKNVPSISIATLGTRSLQEMFSNCTALEVAPKIEATTLGNSCCASMFYNCTKLKEVPELSATTLADSCYNNMFNGCSALEYVEDLPATSLTNSCYNCMFCNCTSLKKAPAIKATSIGNYSCDNMFAGCTSLVYVPDLLFESIGSYSCEYMFYCCTSLVTAPDMPNVVTVGDHGCYRMYYYCTKLENVPDLTAVTLGNNAYQEMFNTCTSLINAPAINVTTLGKNCCVSMFISCSKLTNVPELPCTTLAYGCYNSMFNGCSSLEFAPDLPATTLTENCYNSMFNSCTSLVVAPEIAATSTANSSMSYMFAYCSSLTDVSDLKVTIIAPYACSGMFYACTSLINAPKFDDCTEVKEYGCQEMFAYCTELRNVSELKVPTIGNYAYQKMFQYCSNLVTAPTISASGLAQYCYRYMFMNCTALTVVPNLPATTLAKGCYASMFANCTSLKTVNELPATALTESCYASMFSGCTSLVTAPAIKATTAAYYSCNSMFSSCTKLKTVPELSFVSIGDYGCYFMFSYCESLVTAPKMDSLTTATNYACNGMYYYCTSLRNVPELKATTLGTNCYLEMFRYCTKLEKAPALPATTLAKNCYKLMFCDCASLVETPELPATTLAEACYYSMFLNCTSLIKACELPAEALMTNSYTNMFNTCSSLKEAPVIKAKTVAYSSCSCMFSRCESLTKVPDLLFETIAQSGCDSMFYCCTSLVKAPKMENLTTVDISGCTSMFSNNTQLRYVPDLEAATIGNNAYEAMFDSCINLKVAPQIKATSMGSNALRRMFYYCTSLDIVTTQDEDHPNAWTIPDATVANSYNWNNSIFSYASSTVNSISLTLNTTYYVPEHEYNFVYDKNNSGIVIGTFPKYSGYYNCKSGDKITIASNEFTIPGYNFLGWSLDSEATAKDYDNGAEFTIDSHMIDDCFEITLYAIWEVDTTDYSVSFSNSGSKSGTAPTYEGSQRGGTIINLSEFEAVDLEKDEYIFIGWNTTENATEVIYSYLINKDDVTFYPVWFAKSEVVISETAQTYTYNKNSHSFIISGGITTGFTVLYKLGEGEWTATVPTNAGTYSISLARDEDDEYKEYEKIIENGLVIKKAKYNTSILVWDYDDNHPFEHDGNAHSIAFKSLPTGLTATYKTNNDKDNETDIGIYTMTATFAVEDTDNYEVPTALTRSFRIKAVEINIKNTTIDKVYDAVSISESDILNLFTITGVLNDTETAAYFYQNYAGKLYVEVPNSYEGECVTISNKKYVLYSNFRDIVNAGSYTLYITFGLSDVYEDAKTNLQTYTNNNLLVRITKKVLTDSDITLPTIDLTYDGESHVDDLAATYKNIAGNSVDLKLTGCVIYGNIPNSIAFTNAGYYTARYAFNTDAEALNYAFGNVNGTYYSANYNIKKIKVDEPSTTSAFTYDGLVKEAVITGVESYMTEGYASVSKATNAGTYTIIYELDCNHEWNDGSDGEFTWTIAKADYDMSNVSWGPKAHVYDGNVKSVGLINLPAYFNPVYTNNSYTDLGDYTASVVLTSLNNNYNSPSMPDFAWSIVNKKINSITCDNSYTFTFGDTITFTPSATHGEIVFSVALNTLVNAGEYQVTLTVAEDDDYVAAEKIVTVVINKLKVAEPTVSGTYVYDGQPKEVTVNGVESYMSTSSLLSQTNAGEYDLVYTLDDNHAWDDNSDGTIKWTIDKADLSMANVEWDYTNAFVYDGNSKTVTLSDLPGILVPSYTNNEKTDVGDYTASVTFAVSNTNYNVPTFADLNWSIINKLSNAISALDSYEFTYGDTIEVNATATNGTVIYSPELSTLVDAGEYQVTLNVAEDDTYASAQKTITIVIKKADNNISNFECDADAYCGNSIIVSANVVFGDVVLTYSSEEFGTYTSTVPTSAGHYFVKATSVGNDNYISKEEVKSFDVVHYYEFDRFEWNDYSAVVITKCTCNDEKQAEASVSSSVTTEPTCTSKGIRTYVATYKGCMDSKQAEVQMAEHDVIHHDALAATCTAKGHNAYDTCRNCSYSTYVETPIIAHDLDHHDALAPTCTTKGHNAYDTCKNCSYTTYFEVAALDHNYNVSYSWNNDCSKCTASAVCAHDNSHVITEVVDTFAKVTDSSIVYKTLFDNSLFATQTKTIDKQVEENKNSIVEVNTNKKNNTTTPVNVTGAVLIAGELQSSVVVVIADSVHNEYKELNKSLQSKSKGSEILSTFDIHLESEDGDAISNIDGNKYRVTVSIPENIQNRKNYKICHIADNGDITIYDCVVNGITISFETTHFSEWAIIADSEGLPAWAVVLIVLFSLVLLVIALFIVWFMEYNSFVKSNKDLSKRALKVFDEIFNPLKSIFIKARA